MDKNFPVPASNHIRKDYANLFERFFYFLEDIGPNAFGLAVFDELEKIQSHLLVGQMDNYFKWTMRGRQRAGRILPEPLFVHSDLTTGIQIADLVAYTLSWGLRFREMTKPARPELAGYVSQACRRSAQATRFVLHRRGRRCGTRGRVRYVGVNIHVARGRGEGDATMVGNG